MIFLKTKAKKIGKTFQIYIDSYNSYSLSEHVEHRFYFNFKYRVFQELERQTFFPVINNIAHLLFSKVNRKVWNDLKSVVTRGQIGHLC